MTEPFVRPDVRAFLNFLAAVPGPRMHQMDAPSARAQFLAMKDVADPPVGELAVIRDLVAPGPAGDIPLRLLLATVVGALIGLNREMRHKPAGLRTHALVALGAAVDGS